MHVSADHYRLCLFLCCRWAKNNYSSQGGKPIWVDPRDPRVQHIFIDDNIRLTDSDTIVHPQVLLGTSIAPILFLIDDSFCGSFAAFNYNSVVPFLSILANKLRFRRWHPGGFVHSVETRYCDSSTLFYPSAEKPVALATFKSTSASLARIAYFSFSKLSQRWQRWVSQPPVIIAGD